MNRKAYKPCRVCGKEKSLAEFYPHPQCKDGFRNTCKQCSRKKWGKQEKADFFLPDAITKMSRLYKSTKIQYFGYFIGMLIYLRKNEILAFSVLKGSVIFKYKNDAKGWLIQQAIRAGERIQVGLTRLCK